MKEPLISVVVPAFNCAKYLRSCLNSILGQSYKNFEVILVNDGSTDETTTICKEFVKQHRKMAKVYCQSNQGPSAARNSGIRLSSGEFISFLDGDDYWDHGFLETMLKTLQKFRADIVICDNYRVEVRKGMIVKTEVERRPERLLTSSNLHSDLLMEDLIGGPSRILCPRRFVKDLEGFDERFCLNEMWDFWIRFFESPKNVSLVRTPLYYYHIRDDGSNITRRLNSWRKIYENYLLYNKFRHTILEKPIVKKAYADLFWNNAITLFFEKEHFWRIFLFLLLSQKLQFSIFFKTYRFLKRKLTLQNTPARP